MILDILAKTDALFAPARTLGPRPASYQLQRDYRQHGGLTWHAAGDAATRQRLVREAEQLAEDGKLVMVKSGTAFRVRLTDQAEDDLRRRCCVAGLQAALPLLATIRDHLDAGRGYGHGGRRWLRETTLAGMTYGDPDSGPLLGLLEEAALPLLSRGLLLANCDHAGRCWFTITDDGERAAEDTDAGEPQHHQPQAKARREYLHSFHSERDRLARTPARDPREIGPVPLPEGVSDGRAA